jgi:uncharacterized membrane protein YcfT
MGICSADYLYRTKQEGQQMDIERRGLNSNQLKMIAIIAMTIDHIAWTFFPGYCTDSVTLIMHTLGRLTAPIMMYFIAEGYYHTRNVKKYIGHFSSSVSNYFLHLSQFFIWRTPLNKLEFYSYVLLV